MSYYVPSDLRGMVKEWLVVEFLFLGSSQVKGVPVKGLVFPFLTEIASGHDLGLRLNLDSGVPLCEGGLNAVGFRILLFVLVMQVETSLFPRMISLM